MTNPLNTLELLIESRGRAERGKWILGGCSGRMITTPSGYVGDGFLADFDTKDNAQFAVDAADFVKNEAPRLLAQMKRQREALEETKKAMRSQQFAQRDGDDYEGAQYWKDLADVCEAALNDEGDLP